MSNHQAQEDSLKSSTRVKAEIRTLTVGRKKRLTAERLSAEMMSHSPTGSGEPPIMLGDVAVTGVKIDGFELMVELATGIFNENDTRAKLLTAADTPAFVKKLRTAAPVHEDRARRSAGGAAPRAGSSPGRSPAPTRSTPPS